MLIWILTVFIVVVKTGIFFLRFIIWFTCPLRQRPVLVAYADYPPWRVYIEAHVLPRARGRAIVIKNWSFMKRARYPLLDRVAFMLAAGPDSVPIIIRFRAFSAPRLYPLREAFRHYQAGRPGELERLVAEAFNPSVSDQGSSVKS